MSAASPSESTFIFNYIPYNRYGFGAANQRPLAEMVNDQLLNHNSNDLSPLIDQFLLSKEADECIFTNGIIAQNPKCDPKIGGSTLLNRQLATLDLLIDGSNERASCYYLDFKLGGRSDILCAHLLSKYNISGLKMLKRLSNRACPDIHKLILTMEEIVPFVTDYCFHSIKQYLSKIENSDEDAKFDHASYKIVFERVFNMKPPIQDIPRGVKYNHSLFTLSLREVYKLAVVFGHNINFSFYDKRKRVRTISGQYGYVIEFCCGVNLCSNNPKRLESGWKDLKGLMCEDIGNIFDNINISAIINTIVDYCYWNVDWHINNIKNTVQKPVYNE